MTTHEQYQELLDLWHETGIWRKKSFEEFVRELAEICKKYDQDKED